MLTVHPGQGIRIPLRETPEETLPQVKSVYGLPPIVSNVGSTGISKGPCRVSSGSGNAVCYRVWVLSFDVV